MPAPLWVFLGKEGRFNNKKSGCVIDFSATFGQLPVTTCRARSPVGPVLYIVLVQESCTMQLSLRQVYSSQYNNSC